MTTTTTTTYPEATARTLLERAIAHASKPALSEADVDTLMAVAASEDALGATIYTSAGLNRAAATGWSWKAGLTADQIEIKGSNGKALSLEQWHDHCVGREAAFASGAMTVDGAGSRRRGRVRSLPIIGSVVEP